MPNWLPCLPPLCALLIDALLCADCVPAELALERLAPRCSASAGAPTATLARRLLLARFLAPASPGVAQLAQRCVSVADRAQALALLLSLPERCCAPPSPRQSVPTEPLLANPELFAASLAASAAAAAGASESSLAFCSLLWARLLRRGCAGAVAATALSPRNARAAGLIFGRLEAEDRFAAEKLCLSVLLSLPRLPLPSDAERCALLSNLVGGCSAEFRFALFSDRLLLKKPLPRPSLRLLLRLCCASAELLPPLASSLQAAWCDPAFSAGGETRMQHYLSAALIALLSGPPPEHSTDEKHSTDAWQATLSVAAPGLTSALLPGIAARLGAPTEAVRRCGMRVAAAMARAIRAQRAGGGGGDAAAVRGGSGCGGGRGRRVGGGALGAGGAHLS